MDKLRAMEYLVRVVEARSFAAAARERDVSPPAVTQTIAALEKRLGTKLLRRSSRGVTLTPDGEAYYELCVRTLSEVSSAEEKLRAGQARASGVLVVGMSRIIARNCIMPELPSLLKHHPELQVDVRSVHTTDEALASLVDVMLVNAWDQQEDMTERRIAQTRYVTCASPAYWRARGMPRDPEELRSHVTLAYRTSRGVVMDEWKYRRGEVGKTVRLKPTVIADDRDSNMAAALRGLGVVRTPDLTIWPLLEQGHLVPVLGDWEALDAPPIRVLYRRGMGSSARVRAFTTFATDVFARLNRARSAAGVAEPLPQPTASWYRARWRSRPGSRRPVKSSLLTPSNRRDDRSSS